MQVSSFEREWQDHQNKLKELSSLIVQTVHNYRTIFVQPIQIEFPKQKRTHLIKAYNCIYNECNKKPDMTAKMFQVFTLQLYSHILSHEKFEQQNKHVKCTDPLLSYIKLKKSYFIYLSYLSRQVFYHLDRYFLPAKNLTLQIAGVEFFSKSFISDDVQLYLCEEYTRRINQKRMSLCCVGGPLLLEFMISVRHTDPPTYKMIQKIFVANTKQFYQTKAQAYKLLPPISYYFHVHNLILFEQVVIQTSFLISNANEEMFRQDFKEKFILSYIPVLLTHQKGLIYAMKNKQLQFLKVLIKIYTQFEALEPIKKKYFEHVCQDGIQILNKIANSRQQNEVIDCFFPFIQQQSILVKQGFNANLQIYSTMSNAFEKILERCQKMPFYLFAYVREVIEKGDLAAASAKIKFFLDKIAGKDEFLHLYEDYLQTRILAFTCVYEKQSHFLSLLGQTCVSELVPRLQQKLKQYANNYTQPPLNGCSPVDRCSYLQCSLWSSRFQEQKLLDVVLHPNLMLWWSMNEQKFLKKQPKKNLTLLVLQSKLLLRVHFNRRSVDMLCNVLQGSILLCASDPQLLPLSVEKTLLAEMVSTMPFIIVGEERCLVNWDYCFDEGSVDVCAKLPAAKRLMKGLLQDKSILVQAAIVRLVKRVKEISKERIGEGIVPLLKLFKPTEGMVYAAVDKLIAKSYLEEGENAIIRYRD